MLCRVGAKMKDVYELTLAAVSGIVAMSRSTGSHMTDKLHSTSLAVVRWGLLSLILSCRCCYAVLKLKVSGVSRNL